MTVYRTPTEIWQIILCYSISLPVFLETDPIKACGYQEFVNFYNDKSLYWNAERQRNILRRVCKHWNIYLIQFEHRFVDLSDVHKGHVPISAIRKAIRIEYEVLSWGVDFRPLVEASIYERAGPWSLEILEGGDSEIDRLILMSGKIPRLRSIACSRGIDLSIISSRVPSLQFLDILCDTSQLLQQFRMDRLTTMSIMLDPVTPLLSADLPSLKHLHIQTKIGSILPISDYLKLITTFGKNLITLFDRFHTSESLGIMS